MDGQDAIQKMRFKTLALAFALVLTGASGSDPIAPTMESIAGDYTATSFVGDGIDVLAAGGSLTLSLGTDGQLREVWSFDVYVATTVGGGVAYR